MVKLYLSVNGCLLISSLCIFSIVFIKTEQVANTDNCIIQLNQQELVAQTPKKCKRHFDISDSSLYL